MNKHLILGIDIDDTLSTTETEIKLINEYFKKNITKKDLKSYNMYENLGIKEEEEDLFWEKNMGRYVKESQLSIPFYTFLINELIPFTKEIYIITNRDIEYYNDTKMWLLRNLIPHNELIMTSGASKLPYIQKYNINLMFDDKDSFFEEVANNQPSLYYDCQFCKILKPWNLSTKAHQFTFDPETGEFLSTDNKNTHI